MKGLDLGLLFVTLCVLGSYAQDSEPSEPPPTYVVVAPSVIRAGRPFDLSISILEARSDVVVSAGFSDSRSTYGEGEITISPGSTDTLTLQIPNDLPPSAKKLVVTGSGGLTFSAEEDLEMESKTMSIYVQTDKAIYKPGQIVQFRTFAVYPDLKPYYGEMDIEIYDAKGNKIKQWIGVEDTQGVVSNELQLSDYPILGDWKIKVSVQGQFFEKPFTIDEYVLPKFEVTVECPSYYMLEFGDLQCSVMAKYTYGKPVEGTADVEITLQNAYYRYDYGIPPPIRITKDLDKGKADIILTHEQLTTIAPYGNSYIYPVDDIMIPRGDAIEEDGGMLKKESAGSAGRPGPPGTSTGGNTATHDLMQIKGLTIVLKANVTEGVTDITLSGEGTVDVKRAKYQLKFSDMMSENFKPGLAFTGYVELSQPDGMPPSEEDLENPMEITITCKDDSYQQVEMEDGENEYPVGTGGMVVFTVAVPEDCYTMDITAKFDYGGDKSVTEQKRGISKFKSDSDMSIQIGMIGNTGPVKPDEYATFELSTTKDITGFYYQLVSKGVIVESRFVSVSAASRHQIEVYITTELAQKLAPNARIVVWCITTEGEILSDSLDISVNGAFANDVSIRFSTNRTRPAEDLDLNIAASPHSYVGVLAIDQSVLLLKSGNDISQSDVLEELESFDSSKKGGSGGGYPGPMMFKKRRRKRCFRCGPWWPISMGGQDSSEIFENAGVVVMTDANIHKTETGGWDGYLYFARPEAGVGAGVEYEYDEMDGMDGAEGARGDADDTGGAGTNEGGLQEVGRVRKSFPETWLWVSTTASENGIAAIEGIQAPDTITSWIASAFAINTETGLGVAPIPAKVTVFKPFFASLNLPYSIIRGEEFELQVIAFNYLQEAQDVLVKLKASESFRVRLSPNDIEGELDTEMTAELQVGPETSVSVSFWIEPVVLGMMPIEVTAQSNQASDGLRRMLLVEPEGATFEYSTSKFIDLTDDESPDFSAELRVELPPSGVVPDSQYIRLSVVGDIMGPTIKNLGSLLQMPYGCGEQNMLTTAPNVYVMLYLTAVDQVTNEIRDKAIKFMETGYQRELQYQRIDGSFSAFGDSDQAGSVWLSSFVLRVFHESKDFITIDDNVMQRTITWVLRRQQEDGSFTEPPNGRVIHTEMQGGSSKGIAMTAYVLIALIENNKDSEGYTSTQLENAIDKAVVHLEGKLSEIEDDAYSLAIVTYALQLAESSRLDDAMEMLNNLAHEEDGMKYWLPDDGQTTAPDDEDGAKMWRPPYHQAKASAIETNAYALLAMVEYDLSQAIPVLRWLVSQQNSLGGFASTQDTVLGLQSLGQCAAEVAGNGNQDMMVTFIVGEKTQSFNIDADNSMLTQIYEVTEDVDEIELLATGSGIAIVQAHVQYNTFDINHKPGVALVLECREEGNMVYVTACTMWSGEKESGMGLIEFQALSGTVWTNYHGLPKMANNLVKKVETSGKKLSIYVDEFTTESQCIEIEAVKTIAVNNLQAARASAIVYYDPDTSDSKMFLPGVGDVRSEITTRRPVGETSSTWHIEPVIDGDNAAPSTRGAISVILITLVAMLLALCMIN